MNITRRDALMGATAAAVVTGAATTPRTMKAAPADDPVITLARRLRAASAAWLAAEEAFEDACHRVGFDVCDHEGLVPVETSDGRCTWGADEIREAAEEERQRAGRELRRELGLEPPWREAAHWKTRFWDLHARVLAMPAATPGGILAKLRGFYPDHEIAQIRAGGEPDDDLPAAWAASVYRDLERLA